MIGYTVGPFGIRDHLKVRQKPFPALSMGSFGIQEGYEALIPLAPWEFPKETSELRDFSLFRAKSGQFFIRRNICGDTQALVQFTGFGPETTIGSERPELTCGFSGGLLIRRSVKRFSSPIIMLSPGAELFLRLDQEVLGLKGKLHKLLYDGEHLFWSSDFMVQKFTYKVIH